MTQKNSFFKFTTKLIQENQIEIKIVSDPLNIWNNYSRIIYAIVAKRAIEYYGELDAGFRVEGIAISKPKGINIGFMGSEIERIMAKVIEKVILEKMPEFRNKQLVADTSSSGSITILSTVDNI